MTDLRLIEDYLPIEAISAEASREKSVRKGHISTLHLWWARRPLVACRAAVYGALVPADRWFNGELPAHNVQNAADPKKLENWKNGTKRGLNRKAAKEFVTKLCRYPKTDPTKKEDIKVKNETEAAIVTAQRHILEAHADRLTDELTEVKTTGKAPAWVEEFKFKGVRVTYDDIVAGRAPRPRVLDMFAGGGAIPLEALRLGCEAYALDLNPVAHIIQLCTLVYPQKYGRPDPAARGMTGPKNAKGETTWGGLAAEVRYWGNWVLDRVRKGIGDLYPPIPDPEVWATPPEIAFDRETGQWNVTKPGKPKRKTQPDSDKGAHGRQREMHEEPDQGEDGEEDDVPATVQAPPGFLQPVAYLWTRTVQCKNPACRARVPLVKQTWICRKPGRYAAFAVKVDKRAKCATFSVVESDREAGIPFDPTSFSERGNAVCPFCGTVAENEYVKSEGCANRLARQLMGLVCRTSSRATVYLGAEAAIDLSQPLPDRASLSKLLPSQPMDQYGMSGFRVQPYGMHHWGDIYGERQISVLSALAEACRSIRGERPSPTDGQAVAVATFLAAAVDRLANYLTELCVWRTTRTCVLPTFSRQSVPMVWDFGEMNPFAGSAGDWQESVEYVAAVAEDCLRLDARAIVRRGTATEPVWRDELFDGIVTDPPYYDNVSYGNISDFFYVWLKRTLGDIYPEHFGTELTPKKNEAIANAERDGGRAAARSVYERMMREAFSSAHRMLKLDAPLVVVYAHKTTAGWATLVDALRRSGFSVTEAWPIDTEMAGGMRADLASLASSIFLVSRKRPLTAGTGNYEDDVQPELQQIVRERVATLWEMGIAGADLVIACVGAGLRAFTKYEKVEYANGEEVPAEKFLAEVEGVVLDTMMGKLSGVVGGNVSAVDNASRFYVLWRFVYKTAELDAGEAIVFSNGTHIELDGPQGLSAGNDALVEKKKAKYRARDFTERGDEAKLGLPSETGQAAPLIDALHRILWLMENSPRKLGEFLDEARPDRERLRALAQALAGAALSGKSEEEAGKLVSTTPAEQAALGKLLANWRSLVESRLAAEDNTLFRPKERSR